MEKKKNSTKETGKDTKDTFDKLDSLLLDGEDDSVIESPVEDKAQFDAFMAEYRSLMNKSLRKEEAKEEIFEEKEEVFKAIPNKKSAKKVEKKVEEEKKNDNWDEAITLNPENYVDPGEEDKVMVDSQIGRAHV